VVFVVADYYVSQVLAGVLVSIYPALKHWSNAQANSWLTNSVTAQFIYIALAEAFTVGAIYLFLRRYKLGFGSIGLRRPRWSDPLFGLAAVPAYFILYFIAVGVVSHFVPSLNVNQQQQIGFTSVHGGAQLVMTFISLVILPPLAEEIMVRGFLYSSLKKGMPTVAAVIVTSAIFASAHLPEGGAAGLLYIAAVDTFVLSLVLIYLREKTGSLWSSITLHALKNGIAFVALFGLHAR
jgi:membrane protease YdiL (CAAX protease family)